MLAALITLSPLSELTGTRFDVNLCTVNDRSVCGLDGTAWEPAVTKAPAIGMQFWNGDFEQGAEAGKTSFAINLEQISKSMPGIVDALWMGADVEIRIGRVGQAWPWATFFKGRITSYAGDAWPVMPISAEIDIEPFNVDVLTATYAGTGDAEGGDDLKNRVKPLALGRPRSVEPVLINAVDSVYQFSAYGPIEAVETLYERASAFPASSGDYADYAALVAADIDPGHWATCLAEGLIRLGAPAYGVITGDIRGHAVSGTAPRGAGALVDVLADIAGVSSSLVSASTLTALDAEGATNSDVMITDQVKFLEAARRLVLPCNWQVVVSNLGVMVAVKPQIGASADFTLHAQGKRTPLVAAPPTEEAVSVPYRKTTMAAERCWRVHSFDEIATEAQLIDRGDYDAATVYREGNLVTTTGGERWRYISANPQAGVTPGTDGAVWEKIADPITAVDGSGTALETLIADAQATADAKRTVFYQSTPPSHLASEENDLWINSADGNRLYRRVAGTGRLAIGGDAITIGGDYIVMCWTQADDQRVGQAILDAAGAQATADGKVQAFTMFLSTDPEPVGTGVGDLLYRLYTSPVQIDRWDGDSWEPVGSYGATAAQVIEIANALTAAENAQATADGKIVSYYQTTMPSGGSEGDFWIDTDDGNKLYRHNGTTFVAVQDSGISDAINAAAGAQATADGKVTTFVGESTPTAEGTGDLWYKESTFELRRWDGDSWELVATVGATAAELALIANAQSTADAKRAVFYQSSAPSHLVSEENDLWINSGDGNRLYRRVAGTGRLAIGGDAVTIGGNYITLAWTMADDQRVGQAILDAAGAQATADGKAIVFTMNAETDPEPVGEGVGDILVRLYTSPPQIDHWSGSAWQSAATYGATLAQVQATADAQADADAALTEIGNITSDGVLDKSEKPDIVQRYSAITAEQSGIDAQASALGITTEKTAYDNAVTALTSYLTGLLPAYNDYTQDTAITRTTFNTKFTDVYSARQTLLNKIAEVAATKADWGSVASRPTELTDGRVSAGLDSSGNVNANKVGSTAIVSGAVMRVASIQNSTSTAPFVSPNTSTEVCSVSLTSVQSTKFLLSAAVILIRDNSGSTSGHKTGNMTLQRRLNGGSWSSLAVITPTMRFTDHGNTLIMTEALPLTMSLLASTGTVGDDIDFRILAQCSGDTYGNDWSHISGHLTVQELRRAA